MAGVFMIHNLENNEFQFSFNLTQNTLESWRHHFYWLAAGSHSAIEIFRIWLKNTAYILQLSSLQKFMFAVHFIYRYRKSESTKLRALRAKNVLACQGALLAYVHTCLACLRAHVPTCLSCSCAYVPCVLTCSRANLLCVLIQIC